MQLPIPLPLNAAKISLPALGAPFLLIVILAMVVLPLPPVLLDLLFTFNIFLALVVVGIHAYLARFGVESLAIDRDAGVTDHPQSGWLGFYRHRR